MKLSEKNENVKLKNHLSILENITNAVHSSVSMKEVMENVVNSIRQGINNVSNVSFYLVEGENAVLKAQSSDNKNFPEEEIIPYPQGYTWKTLKKGETLYCNNTKNDPDKTLFPYSFGNRSYASLPLKINSEIAGVININSQIENAFDKDDLNLFNLVKRQVEIAIERTMHLENYLEEKKIKELYLDNAEIITVVIDNDKKVSLINRKGCEILGYNEKEIIGKNWFDSYVPKKYLNEVKEVFRKLLYDELETVEFFINPVITKSKKERTISWHNKTIKNSNGDTVGILSSGIDITDKQLAEQNFRHLVESSPYGMVITNSKGIITSVNREIEKIFGYSRKELTGKSIEILIPERYRKGHVDFRARFVTNPENRPMGEGRDLFALRKDGTEVPVEIGLNVIKGNEDISVLATLTDITKRKNAENKLVESNKALEGIINNSPDAVIVYDENGEILRTNGEFKKLFKQSEENGINNIWQIIPSDQKVKFADLLKQVSRGKKVTDHEMEKTLGNGKRISVGIGLVHIDSGNGTFIETVRDITERVSLRNRILDFEKAQIVSKMAEGIAHHMGTPLASMLLRVQMLKEDITAESPDENIIHKLDSVEKNIMYGQKIMQKLLRFANRPSSEKTKVDISALLENASEIIKPLCQKSGISLELDTEPFYVKGDPDMLELVISDLMMNAIDAMPDGGVLRLCTEKNSDNFNKTRIIISDTGTGIPEDILPFVFEPFYSSKPSGKGTGLGLAVAKRIINDHLGEIGIKTTIGKGTEIGIELPPHSEENV